jgi:O-antigen/teichoic acid export membrane protein
LSQIKKLAGQTAIYGLSSILGRLLNYLLVPFYTRVFVPAEYGVVSEFYAYVTFLIIIYTFGMETAYFHFSSKSNDEESVFSNCLITLSGISAVTSGLLILFSQSIATALGYAHHPEYITWFALILAFDALTAIPFARLRKLGKAKTFAGLRLLNIFLNICFNLFFISLLPALAKESSFWSNFYSPTIGIGYVFLSNLIASAVTFLFLLPSYRSIKFPVNQQLIKSMLIYAFPLLIAGFAGMINETLDRAILKYLVSDKSSAMEQLGIYSACYKLSILMTLFVQTFRYASEPFFFAQQHKENSRQLYARVMDYFVYGCCIILLGVLLFLDILKYFIGPNYYAGLKVVPILLLANLCLGVYLNLSIWYKLTGNTRYGAGLSIIGAVITIGFNFWLIPVYGYMGAAWTTLICYAAMMVLSYWKGQQFYKVPYDVMKMLGMVVAALLFWCIGLQLDQLVANSVVLLNGLRTLLLLIYAGLCWKWIYQGKLSIQTR